MADQTPDSAPTHQDGDPLHDEGTGILLASTNTARQRPKHLPHTTSQSYIDWRAQKYTAFQIAVHNMGEELGEFTNTAYMTIKSNGLILNARASSQSKLSQQELGDLQKATHFDKKELQQWYKGAFVT